MLITHSFVSEQVLAVDTHCTGTVPLFVEGAREKASRDSESVLVSKLSESRNDLTLQEANSFVEAPQRDKRIGDFS